MSRPPNDGFAGLGRWENMRSIRENVKRKNNFKKEPFNIANLQLFPIITVDTNANMAYVYSMDGGERQSKEQKNDKPRSNIS